MPKLDSNPSKPASEEIFTQIEEDLNPGPLRDLWWSIRGELSDGGPQSVRSYLKAEYERRYSSLKASLEELANRMKEIT